MLYRDFGRTGWRVSEIGFGAWQLGGTWGEIGDAHDTLLYAFERGVNFVDTASLYGGGQSETVVGDALRDWGSEKVYVATKAPPLSIPDADDLAAPMRGQYPEEHLRGQVEASLRRLQVDRIDLLQLHHWIPNGVFELDWLETLNALRLEGKIDRIGVSLRDIRPGQGLDLARLGLVDSIQVMFNIFEQEPLEELFPAAASTRTGILARVPLDSGALSGAWTETTYDTWAENDKRRQMYRDERFPETLSRVRAVERETGAFYPGLAEAALRFALHPPAVSTVLVGMRNRAEVDANLAIVDGNAFPPELAGRLRDHAWKHEFYA